MFNSFNTLSASLSFQRLQRLCLVLGLVVGWGVFTGCDLGTYNKRLNDRTSSPPRAAKEKAGDADTTDTDDAGSDDRDAEPDGE